MNTVSRLVIRVVDWVTLLEARYEKDVLPWFWRLNRLPCARAILVTMPTRLCDALVTAVSRLTSHSEVVLLLNENLATLRIAQIGGTTRTMFDRAGRVVSFNTHDWRSADDGSNGSDYIKLSGVGLPVDDSLFDVVATRHVLEHIANPVTSLLEWKRVLKPGGYLFVSVPNRSKTEETRRALTPIRHFILDYEAAVPEFDPTHEAEIRKAGCGIIQHDIYENPHIHYHTFEERNLKDLLEYCGFEILELTARDLTQFRHQPWDLIMLARKSESTFAARQDARCMR